MRLDGKDKNKDMSPLWIVSHRTRGTYFGNREIWGERGRFISLRLQGNRSTMPVVMQARRQGGGGGLKPLPRKSRKYMANAWKVRKNYSKPPLKTIPLPTPKCFWLRYYSDALFPVDASTATHLRWGLVTKTQSFAKLQSVTSFMLAGRFGNFSTIDSRAGDLLSAAAGSS